MPDYVWVRQPETGHRYTVTREQAMTLGLDIVENDQPTTDSSGRPLDPKVNVSRRSTGVSPSPADTTGANKKGDA